MEFVNATLRKRTRPDLWSVLLLAVERTESRRDIGQWHSESCLGYHRDAVLLRVDSLGASGRSENRAVSI